MITLERIRSHLAEYRPAVVARSGPQRAAVAMILREGERREPEVLFIERARTAGDPWAGHMAFPGGRVEPSDASPRDAAERETLEEVGLSLSDAASLGRLDDLEGRDAGRAGGLVISAFVYHHHAPGPLVENREVASTLWVPVRQLASAERHVEHVHPLALDQIFPGIRVGEPDRHVVWGLTYRFVEVFFRVMAYPFPRRWGLRADAVLNEPAP